MGFGAPVAKKKGTDCPRDDSDKHMWVRKRAEDKHVRVSQGSLKMV